MTQHHRKNSNFFQFGTPYGVNRRHAQSDFSVNFNKVFESWSKLRDLLTPASNVDAEGFRHILPCLFQANQNGSVGSKNFQRKSCQNPKDSKVSYHLKCSDIAKNNVIKTRKKKNTKTTTVNKIYNTQSKEKPSRPTKSTSIKLKKANSITKNRDAQKKINPTKKINSFECPECKRCSDILLQKGLPKQRKRNTTTLTLSQERLLQALIELDPRAYGDSVSLGLQSRSKIVHTILKENPNINIKNLELKYLNPTYVIQMTTEATPPPRKYERAFSFAALDAHLGQTSPPVVVRTKRASEQTSMHYDDSEPHIVGVGQRTEHMWRERQNSTANERTASHRSSRSNRFEVERKVTWTEDPPPLFRLLQQEPLEEVKRVEAPTPKKTESKCNRFVEFIKRCFCLSDSNFVKVEIPSRKVEKKDLERLKKYAKLNKNTNANASITRTTRDEFIKTNKTTTQG